MEIDVERFLHELRDTEPAPLGKGIEGAVLMWSDLDSGPHACMLTCMHLWESMIP